MGECFLKPKYLKANVKVELDLSNYATKADLKNATGVDTIKLDIGKLEKTEYNELI